MGNPWGEIVENKDVFFWYKSMGHSWWCSKSRDCFYQPVVAANAINFSCCLLKCVVWILLVQQAHHICQVFTFVSEAVCVLESQGPKNPWHLHPKLYSECIGRNSSEIKWNVKWYLARKNMDLLLVIRRKTVSDNKNKALCWGNLNRYLMVLLYSMWNV